MLGIKKQLIKSMIKLEVVGNAPGELQIYVAQIKKVEEEQKHYEAYAKYAIEIFKGIQNLDVDYQKGIITIKYDSSQINAQQIYKDLQMMIDLGIEYYDDLKLMWEVEGDEDQKVEAIWQKIRPILVNAMAKI